MVLQALKKHEMTKWERAIPILYDEYISHEVGHLEYTEIPPTDSVKCDDPHSGEFCEEEMSKFLKIAFGANKFGGARPHPSAGNFYPTEVYSFSSMGRGMAVGAHYSPVKDSLVKLNRKIIKTGMDKGEFYICLAIRPYKAFVKYSHRCWRFTFLDLGHAFGAAQIAANVMGLEMDLVSADSETTASNFGFQNEFDQGVVFPGLVFGVRRKNIEISNSERSISAIAEPLIEAGSQRKLECTLLDKDAPEWERNFFDPIVFSEGSVASTMKFLSGHSKENLYKFISERKSCRHFKKNHQISMNRFEKCAEGFLAGGQSEGLLGTCPILIRDVQGLQDGLYCFAREQSMQRVRPFFHSHFLWEPVPTQIQNIELYRLDELKANLLESMIFKSFPGKAFNMLFLPLIDFSNYQTGKEYPVDLVQTGISGQLVYLSSYFEKLGVTGVGAYIDELANKTLLGNIDDRYQCVIGYAVGGIDGN